MTDNIFQHIDVREDEKENAFSLGKKLIINHEEFEVSYTLFLAFPTNDII